MTSETNYSTAKVVCLPLADAGRIQGWLTPFKISILSSRRILEDVVKQTEEILSKKNNNPD